MNQNEFNNNQKLINVQNILYIKDPAYSNIQLKFLKDKIKI